jgi:GNAT superfamily N-acetyltransferase
MASLLSLTRFQPVTEARVRDRWQSGESENRLTLVAISEAEECVGLMDVGPDAWIPADDFRCHLVVEPAWRNQGIGTHLYDMGRRFAGARGARRLQGRAQDGAREAVQFAERRGFRIGRHEFQSVLVLNAFDEGPFVHRLDATIAAGFTFLTMADLEPATEDLQLGLYELNRVTGLDNPSNEGSFPSYEVFCRSVFQVSWYRPEGQILAAGGDRWSGLAMVAYEPETKSAHNTFTGVDRPYRGQGLAQALKLLAIRYARAMGATTIGTGNDSLNAPMLAINEKLGYRRLPGIYHLVCDVD